MRSLYQDRLGMNIEHSPTGTSKTDRFLRQGPRDSLSGSGAKIIGNEFAWTGQSVIGPLERDCVVWLRMSPRIHSVGVCIYTLGVLGSAQPLPSSYIPPSYILPPPAATSPAGPPAGRRILVDKRIRRLPELRPARKRSFLSLPMFVPSLS
jgi:hypothetical protein